MDLVKVIRRVQRKKADRERSKSRAFCLLCNEQVPLMSSQEAAQLNEASRLKIGKFIRDGLIHRIHNSRGEVLICRYSIEQADLQAANTLPLDSEFLKSFEKK